MGASDLEGQLKLEFIAAQNHKFLVTRRPSRKVVRRIGFTIVFIGFGELNLFSKRRYIFRICTIFSYLKIQDM